MTHSFSAIKLTLLITCYPSTSRCLRRKPFLYFLSMLRVVVSPTIAFLAHNYSTIFLNLSPHHDYYTNLFAEDITFLIIIIIIVQSIDADPGCIYNN